MDKETTKWIVLILLAVVVIYFIRKHTMAETGKPSSSAGLTG